MPFGTRGYLILGGIVLGALSGKAWTLHERSVGARDERIASLRGENGQLRAIVTADSAALGKKDTVRVFLQVLRVDSSLAHLLDSVNASRAIQPAPVHDTVTVERTVLVEAKAALDSTKSVADACCQLARDRGRRIAVVDSMNAALIARDPSPVKPWLDFGLGVGACGVAVWLARR